MVSSSRMVSSWSSQPLLLWRGCLDPRREGPPDREWRRDEVRMEERTGDVLGDEMVDRVPVEAVRGRICSRLLQSCSCCCCRRRYFCKVNA